MRLTVPIKLGTIIGLVCAATFAIAQVDVPDFEEFGIDPNVSYSATRYIETGDGSFEIREYRAPQMFRAEMGLGDETSTMITREDRQTGYLLLPSMNTYMEIPSQQVLDATHQARVVERRRIGRETVLGHPATKYHAVFVDPDGARHTGHMWVTDEGVPIRMEMVDAGAGGAGRMMMELRSLNVAPQDPALFEIPAGYRSFDAGSLEGLRSIFEP